MQAALECLRIVSLRQHLLNNNRKIYINAVLKSKMSNNVRVDIENIKNHSLHDDLLYCPKADELAYLWVDLYGKQNNIKNPHKNDHA